MPGVCYSALRRLPRRDLHPLETNDAMRRARASASSRRTMAAIVVPRRGRYGRFFDDRNMGRRRVVGEATGSTRGGPRRTRQASRRKRRVVQSMVSTR